MYCVRYRVVAAADGWRIFADGERLGRFDSEARALRAALDIARSTSDHPVEVLLENARGEVRTVEPAAWSMADKG
jgi:hypothetical protein